MYVGMFEYAYTHTDTCTHTHIQTDTDTHTHTHTPKSTIASAQGRKAAEVAKACLVCVHVCVCVYVSEYVCVRVRVCVYCRGERRRRRQLHVAPALPGAQGRGEARGVVSLRHDAGHCLLQWACQHLAIHIAGACECVYPSLQHGNML
jgi:hypothetical protein